MSSSSTAADQTQLLQRLNYQPLPYKIDFVDLEFILDPTNTQVSSKLKLRKASSATPDDAKLVLDGYNLDLKSIKINQQLLSPAQYLLEVTDKGAQTLTLDGELLNSFTFDQSGYLTLEIVVICDPQANKTLQGLYYLENLFTTQCESAGFRWITFFFDRPDNSSIYTTKIIAPESYTSLLSNGNKIAEGKLDNGLHFSQWHDPHPKPCYLFALVAGKLDKATDYFVTASGRKVTLEIYVEPGKIDQVQVAMDSLKRSFLWDEQRFGLEYDLDVFMVVAVSSFNMGAMENKGLNIFNDRYILADKDTAIDSTIEMVDRIIAHEYFHNWTGNRVTCRDWFQLTLKEGLTVYRDNLYTCDHFDAAVQRIGKAQLMRNNQFSEDASPISHPIRPDAIKSTDNLYTATVYEKGSEIIRMIHIIIGEAAFQQGMKLYIERFDGSAATCEDFVQAMQDASGVDLMSDFFKWYGQSGTPLVDLKGSYDPTTKSFKLDAKQHTAATLGQEHKQALYIPLLTQLYYPDGSLAKLDNATTGFKGDSELLILKDNQASWTFNNLEQSPIIASNIDFSAPINLTTNNSPEQELILANKCDNKYVKFYLLQNLFLQCYRDNIQALKEQQQIKIDPALVAAYLNNLAHSLESPEYSALLLKVPASATVINQLVDLSDFDPNHLKDIYHAILTTLANAAGDLLVELYQQIPKQAYQFNPEQYGYRRLAALLLNLIGVWGKADHLIKEYYYQADCLDQKISALNAAIHNQIAGYQELTKDFIANHKDNSLVLDEYAKLVATSPLVTIAEVQQLDQLPNFSYEVPNRIYSSFLSSVSNYALFHKADASGYKFIANLVAKIDKYNPTVATRLVSGLVNFGKFDTSYQQAMLKEIIALSQQPISDNLSDPINQALKLAQDLKLI